MASWDTIAAELLRTACSLDADARFRSLALQQQCERLEAVCQFVLDLEASAAEEQTARQEETLAVEQSIQDAIIRARQVRAELAAVPEYKEKETREARGEQEAPLAEETQQLQGILAVAKATRTAQLSQEAAERNTKTGSVPRIRLQYPRKLKALETQLDELRGVEAEASTRFAFCSKMGEHLSLTAQRRQLLQQHKLGAGGKMVVPVARIQTSFPKQVTRLRAAYRRLTEFVLKMEVESPAVQQVVNAPTLSAIFPIYHRLQQAKKMLRLLNGEARALLERLPACPPTLSPTAAAHRDAMLARIRRKRPQPDVGVVDNQALQIASRTAQSPLHLDPELLEKLQAAWAARAPATTKAGRLHDVYATAVREVVLTELSNAVLWSFKTHFADTAEQPDAAQVEAVMRLVRLVDSVALSQGRAYRSVVAR